MVLFFNRHVSRNDADDEAQPDKFNGIGTVEQGSPGYDWFLQLGIDCKDGQDDKMTLLLGLAPTVEILASVLTNFCLLPVNETMKYPVITSGHKEDGFPTTAVITFNIFFSLTNISCKVEPN
jgi:hypothetical protein